MNTRSEKKCFSKKISFANWNFNTYVFVINMAKYVIKLLVNRTKSLLLHNFDHVQQVYLCKRNDQNFVAKS